MSQFGFKGNIVSYTQPLFTDQISKNLLYWLSWSFLEIGAFYNITKGLGAHYGGDRSKLSYIADERYEDYTHWGTTRSDWCWESGLSGTNPIQISGIWVNNSFVSKDTTGQYAHSYNYPLGEVIFDEPIASTTNLQIEYSQRLVQIRLSDEPWFKEVIYNSFREDEDSAPIINTIRESRVQLPCIVIEPVFNIKFVPYEIGSSAGEYYESFLLHIITETPWDKNRLHDVLIKQVEKRISTFDIQTAPPPLTVGGNLKSDAKTYPQLCEEYPWKKLFIDGASSSPAQNIGNKLYWGFVKYEISLLLS